MVLWYLFGRGRQEVKESNHDFKDALKAAAENRGEIDGLRARLREVQREVHEAHRASLPDAEEVTKGKNDGDDEEGTGRG